MRSIFKVWFPGKFWLYMGIGKVTKDIRLVDMLLPNLRFCGSVEGTRLVIFISTY